MSDPYPLPGFIFCTSFGGLPFVLMWCLSITGPSWADPWKAALPSPWVGLSRLEGTAYMRLSALRKKGSSRWPTAIGKLSPLIPVCTSAPPMNGVAGGKC